MKNILKSYVDLPLHAKVLYALYVLAFVVLTVVIPMKPAHAGTGVVIHEAVVLRVLSSDAEAAAQQTGAGLGGLITAAWGLMTPRTAPRGHTRQVVLRLLGTEAAPRIIAVRELAPAQPLYPQECVYVVQADGQWHIVPRHAQPEL